MYSLVFNSLDSGDFEIVANVKTINLIKTKFNVDKC